MSTEGMNENAILRGIELRLATAIGGLLNAIPADTTSINVNGVVVPIADLVKKAREIEKPWRDAREARALLRTIMGTRPRDRKVAQDFLADLKAALVVVLGRRNEDLVKFGFSPQKSPPSPTLDEKVQRAAKAKLTREMRQGPRKGTEIAPNGTSPASPVRPLGTNPATTERTA